MLFVQYILYLHCYYILFYLYLHDCNLKTGKTSFRSDRFPDSKNNRVAHLRTTRASTHFAKSQSTTDHLRSPGEIQSINNLKLTAVAVKKLTRLSARDLPKHEAKAFFYEIINAVDGFDTKALLIEDEVADLKLFLPELETLKQNGGKTPQVTEFNLRRKELHLEIRAVELEREKLDKANFSLTREEKLTIGLFIDKQLHRILKDRNDSIVDRASEFVTAVESDNALKNLFTKGGILDNVLRMKSTLQEMTRLAQVKGTVKAGREPSKTLAIKQKMVNLIHNLLIKIELMSDRMPEIDYTPLITALNNLVVARKSVRKSLSTRNQNLALVNTTTENETTVESSAKTPSTVA